MSRTYRRLTGDMHHRKWLERRTVQTEGYRSREVRDWSPLTKDELKSFVSFHMDGRRTMGQTPSWHWKETYHVPVRAEVRNLIHKVMRLQDLEDTPLFPHHSRPKEWYW